MYNAASGQFTSPDPLFGGNSTAFTYPQDPINFSDASGNLFGWVKSAVRKTIEMFRAVSYAIRQGAQVLWSVLGKVARFLTTSRIAKGVVWVCGYLSTYPAALCGGFIP